MKRKTQFMLVLMTLVSVVFLCLRSTAYAQAEAKDQSLPNGPEIESASGGNSDEIASLTSLIVTYSEQLEEYDRSNGIFVTTCISFAGVILGLAVTLLTARGKKIERPNIALSSLFATLPAMITLFLYVFSIQCRRVAYFRGYLAYLEERLSKLIDTPIVFNRGIVPTYLEQFPTNKYGPIVMGIMVGILFATSIILCIYYATPKKAGAMNPWRKKWGLIFWFLLGVVLIVCLLFCVVCMVDLCTNNDARIEAYDYCVNIGK